MVAVYLAEFLFLAGIFAIAWTQVFVPAYRNKPLFPYFDKKTVQLKGDLRDAEKDLRRAEIERDINTVAKKTTDLRHNDPD